MSTWVVYCLATIDGSRTYIGATVDPDRRLAQHNGLLKGGARATASRPGGWYRVCHVRGFLDSHAAALDACLAWAAAEGVADLEVVWE